MRVDQRVLAALCSAALLTACSGGPGNGGGPPPPGVTITKKPDFAGTLADMASQVTTDTLLEHGGKAKLLKAEPFAPCPGEAGLQTFRVTTPRGPLILEIAFTQWNGTATTASYQRPGRVPENPRALEALRSAVCSTPLGG